jgi:LuxR family maltose regulon positive regulatory protein
VTIPLLTTRLRIPQLRPSRVPRPRLIKWLDEGARLGRKLTLVSAPAGWWQLIQAYSGRRQKLGRVPLAMVVFILNSAKAF